VIHHVSLDVSDLARSGAFYDALFSPLGWRRQVDGGDAIGWGIAKPVFFVTRGRPPRSGATRVSFAATGIAAVKAAWEAGTETGGQDVGKPGPRSNNGLNSYSALIRDPDGYDLEIVATHD
jgi:catechol 2,3-dioxygenase-like lactoylglutathione lyase family enzyme